MRRIPILIAVLSALLAAPAQILASQKSGCPSAESGWQQVTVGATASGFFEHLLPGQFATIEEFAIAVGSYDRNADGFICTKALWGFELNPKSHFYRLGFEIGLGEPVHVLLPRDNNAGAQ